MPKTFNDIDPNFIKWFVLGACIDHNEQVQMFSDNFPLQRMNKQDWIRRVQEKVSIYLNNPSRGPGADCSDFECNLILSARKMFGLRAQDTKVQRPEVQYAGIPKGWKAVPMPGAIVSADHPITCLNPTPTFEVLEVRAEPSGRYSVRGEETCWFGLGMIKPVEQQPIEGGICEWCGGPNLDHMGGSCAEQRQGFKGGYRG